MSDPLGGRSTSEKKTLVKHKEYRNIWNYCKHIILGF